VEGLRSRQSDSSGKSPLSTIASFKAQIKSSDLLKSSTLGTTPGVRVGYIYQALIGDQKCILLSKARKPLLRAPKIGGLYRLDLQSVGEQAHQCLSAIEVHRKLGHISQKSLKYLLEHNMILGIEKQSIGDKINCDVCIQSKIMS
jgi:hypothetical protein